MRSDALAEAIEAARQSEGYRQYLDVRQRVLEMLDYQQTERRENAQPSDYWEQELEGFEYMLDASPLVIQKLRHHCYHLTSIRPYDYRIHHTMRSVEQQQYMSANQQRERFANKLHALQNEDTDDLLVPESPGLGGFGHEIDGTLINVDTLKFYECLIAMNKAGILTPFRDGSHEKRPVMEIGAGWGGFAYQFKTLCPNVTYIIVDLPQTLLFSATYLRTLFPSASSFMYGDKPLSTLEHDYRSYDFVFLPHFSLEELRLDRLDLAMNMVSFQEMTSEQVEGYARKIHDLGCPVIYSLNRDRSPMNDQLTTVSSILGRYYDITTVNVLGYQYTHLVPPAQTRAMDRLVARVSHPLKTLAAMRRRLKWRAGKAARGESPVYEYRHLTGTVRKSLS